MDSGIKFDHYEIRGLLGGGVGGGNQARDEKLGRQISIKFLTKEFAQDADSQARFQCAAQLLTSLNLQLGGQ